MKTLKTNLEVFNYLKALKDEGAFGNIETKGNRNLTFKVDQINRNNTILAIYDFDENGNLIESEPVDFETFNLNELHYSIAY